VLRPRAFSMKRDGDSAMSSSRDVPSCSGNPASVKSNMDGSEHSSENEIGIPRDAAKIAGFVEEKYFDFLQGSELRVCRVEHRELTPEDYSGHPFAVRRWRRAGKLSSDLRLSER
jgi:hypothetical protein